MRIMNLFTGMKLDLAAILNDSITRMDKRSFKVPLDFAQIWYHIVHYDRDEDAD